MDNARNETASIDELPACFSQRKIRSPDMDTATTDDTDYLEACDVEAVARMVNALLVEHWIMRDRLAILEQLLIDHGILDDTTIDRYAPTADFAARLEALRDTVFANVLEAPFSEQHRSVENLRAKRP